MKSSYQLTKESKINKKGVFGLTSVQAFFAIILGLAILAYVIVVIMGTLMDSSVVPASSLSTTVTNESGGFINNTGYTLAKYTTPGFASPSIVLITNTTDGKTIAAGNYTLTGNVLTNATAKVWDTVKITYTYSYNSVMRNNANDILGNTSGGVSNFFGSVNPVYAILAILVIILILVVLVRVVTSGAGSGRAEYNPQL